MEGVKFSFDYLLSEAGDRIQFTFDDPDYIEGDGFEEDFTSGIIKCQQQCLARWIMITYLLKSIEYLNIRFHIQT